MKIVDKKRAVALGVRVGITFLAAVAVVIMAAYYVLFQNFQSLMTDYTIKLVEAMTEQGVKVVETELEMERQRISYLADSFRVTGSEEAIEFSQPYTEGGQLRILYVTENGTEASDGRQRDVRNRQDIRDAFDGETAVYGPYFNEENEYVICYSAPVKKSGDIIGVLSVEKDGYRFCELIENIRFIDSGESYIINEEGTDIAVSDQNHIDWVNTQYNARKLYKENADEETKSILELEQKGLNGETGVGTYYWKEGLCYVFYTPITSTGWVLLAGLREEEIVSLTQSTVFASLREGPVLGICLFLVFVLTALIIWWIIASMKKTAEINKKLELTANYDFLTGLMNRNSYHAALDKIDDGKSLSFACIYIDVNGLHDVNNHLGHDAGDEMLKAVADAFREAFFEDEVYRIGGDEFVVICRGKSEQDIQCITKKVQQTLYRQSYEISIGIAYREESNSSAETMAVVNEAEESMQQDKKRFYESAENDRRMRSLDRQLERMLLEKQDADAFLEVLAPEFAGVYFVNLSKDTVRHLYIPAYFEECLIGTDNQFSKAIILYAQRHVKPEYFNRFERVCDYDELERQLDSGQMPEFYYQKSNDIWLKLRILKFKDYSSERRETLWIFANTPGPDKE